MKSPKDMRIIQIDITNACIYKCSNCTRFCGHHKKNFFMDFETFKRAVDSLIGYHGTIGVMGGEPTLHPEFERFVDYLHSKLPKEYKKELTPLINPQKDFIEAILLDNKLNSEIYEYSTGKRETIVGAGLWSAMVPSYKKHYELIQDVFKMQAVNDHGNIMYHSPIFINRRDMGIPDEKWIEIRDNCWAQDVWSATITPKGAFFCEIAGALDMLFDGPGGWPIEPGWWKRTPEQFGDQLKWCELCGIALETFTRNANDWVDDVSESMYKKLKEIESPKLKQGAINLVKIENGIIAEESKKGVKEVRKELFYDSFSSRFNNAKSILFPSGFDIIADANNADLEILDLWLDKNGDFFKTIFFITSDVQRLREHYKNYAKIIIIPNENLWGQAFAKALNKCSGENPIFYISEFVDIDGVLINELKETVINPGTLHVDVHLTGGIVALFHKNARSIKNMGYDNIANSLGFKTIVNNWIPQKKVSLSLDCIENMSEMRIVGNKRYLLFGAGNMGVSALRQITEKNSQVVYFADSDCTKWGEKIENVLVVSPEEICCKRKEFDKIVISCSYFKEVYDKLLYLGFEKNDIIIYE